jgi:hypothetical protein
MEATMSAVVGSDNKPVPAAFKALACMASLQQAASIALTTPTAATTITDADGWAAGQRQVAVADGGITVSATAGTFTIGKAGLYRVKYTQSEITVVNGQVLTAEVYVGSTASKGICKTTQLTAAPCVLAGEVLLSLAAGDIVTLKIIASTGNYTSAQGAIIVEEV